jgi:AraC-like DNA-binding protein
VNVKNKQPNSNKSDARLELENGGALERQKTKLLPDGSYFFENEFDFKGTLSPTIITCTAWLLELFHLKEGEILFVQGNKHLRPQTKRFGIFYPPFSITRPFFKNARGILQGIAGTRELPSKYASVPMIFETLCKEPPASASQVIEILSAGANFQIIETNPKASLLSIKAKKLIDENYLIYPSIARIAARLGVTHAHLTRQFKFDYRMTPNAYLRQLRVADVPLKLARGEQIINVSHDVGYNDLSRFYKQFRKTTQTSPGACQTMMKPTRAKRI